MNLSSGDLPVYFPVFTDNEPVELTTPSFLSTANLTISSTLRFLWTVEGLIPKAINCEENFSDGAVPSTWVRGIFLQKY